MVARHGEQRVHPQGSEMARTPARPQDTEQLRPCRRRRPDGGGSPCRRRDRTPNRRSGSSSATATLRRIRSPRPLTSARRRATSTLSGEMSKASTCGAASRQQHGDPPQTTAVFEDPLAGEIAEELRDARQRRALGRIGGERGVRRKKEIGTPTHCAPGRPTSTAHDRGSRTGTVAHPPSPPHNSTAGVRPTRALRPCARVVDRRAQAPG